VKIPDQLTSSRKSQKFRETQPMHIAYKLVDLDNPNWKEQSGVVIDARVFWPNHSQTCRAVIWINDEKGRRYNYGIGVTSGCGYHHESAAIQDAFMDMGIKFEGGESFDGGGTGAQEKAIRKVAEAMGYDNTLLISFNP
jgi:hypothetical protein